MESMGVRIPSGEPKKELIFNSLSVIIFKILKELKKVDPVTLLIIKKLNLNPEQQLKKAIRGLNGITIYQLIDSLIKNDTIQDAAKALGYTDNPIKQCIREVLHPALNIKPGSFESKGSRERWYTKLLNLVQYKKCYNCREIKPVNCFHNRNNKTDITGQLCKTCDLLKTKLKKHYIAQRTPDWANMLLIEKFYKNCPEGYHVDHIIPLQGKVVSGLHVLENLQYLPAAINLSKNNNYFIE